ncbi:hypothetical protein GCM10007973_01220 [Polymorphobacter multimanifer]|uniref:Two-component system nitrate/nitrite response regulator NarL n=1 Tax=Polymorphobacter multimanifer TaxID=1070431 RepID=A0A841L1G5_9SPHN|nr:response regulator transcription factor [Polymorphobacter multimanifer]MBB6226414.1 two-component system nitrate/nitrite response regulator NarL [Polymorphobacter multimanifer]GGI67837.1 hypothetical protein GCM10007973_01220 [Polymorphobacter multimanifer]
MGQFVSIAIVGKNTIVREGLKGILAENGFQVVSTNADCLGLAKAAADQPELAIDIVIIDSASALDGNHSCRDLRTAFPNARIVLMGDDISVKTTSEALSLGADGYLPKHISSEPLVWSLQLIASGEKILPSQTVHALMASCWRHEERELMEFSNDIDLSDREIAVLRCLTRGDGNKQISRELSITEATVKFHVSAIMRKIGALNRTQAAIWAVSQGVAESKFAASA